MNKKSLSERDICTKFITHALQKAGWDLLSQVREQVHFTKGRIIVRGKLVSRGKDLAGACRNIGFRFRIPGAAALALKS